MAQNDAPTIPYTTAMRYRLLARLQRRLETDLGIDAASFTSDRDLDGLRPTPPPPVPPPPPKTPPLIQ